MTQQKRQPLSLKQGLLLIFICFSLSLTLIIATAPIHEAAHWVMSDIDPYIIPVEIHVFEGLEPYSDGNILSSPLGYVKIKEAYPGAFTDRPLWADAFQEIICVLIQIIITCIVIIKLLPFFITKLPGFQKQSYA
jgi:hypothetical protein